MSQLGDFDSVLRALKTEKKKNVDLLHMFVYENNGDRHNRKRLRNFQGFDFAKDDEEFGQKVSYVAENLSNNDLAVICNILGLQHDKDDLMVYIFRNLQAGNLLPDAGKENDEDDEDDEYDEENDESGIPNRVITRAREQERAENKALNSSDEEEEFRSVEATPTTEEEESQSQGL
ncbi:uncharacterized protein DDB_G0290301-like [Drosophila bipectinata]|uniref:uncharacterized protein DDB_G0290301-like n=1 Tax=Drosophila bipectinata TaxID=42026 RepID=UPI0038B2B1D7